tara:strand:+ start:1474 stop:2346 length:873 start_codon:yes stop_codon:yes gene_type:complete
MDLTNALHPSLVYNAADEYSDNEIDENESEKYEDKYWDEFNIIPNEIILTQEYNAQIDKVFCILLKKYVDCNKTLKLIYHYDLKLELIDEDELYEQPEFLSKVLQSISIQQRESIEKEAYELVRKIKTKRLKETLLMEYTPLGNVIMYFDEELDSFVYFCDKNLSFLYLETVARKYVTSFMCKAIFKENKTPAEEEQKHITESSSTKTPTNTTQRQLAMQVANVFAKLKKYNNITKTTKIENNMGTIKEIVKNRYTYKGKLCNFSFIKEPSSNSKKMDVTFSEFKKNKNI